MTRHTVVQVDQPSDPSHQRRAVVAVIDTSPDTIELLREALEHAGFVTISGFTHDIRSGKLDFEAFLRQHRPRVVVYDIAPPYERNYKLFQHVRSLDCGLCKFVLVSTNAKHVQQLVGTDDRVFEIVDKPLILTSSCVP
jgi:CheY-like chemotaxis protein